MATATDSKNKPSNSTESIEAGASQLADLLSSSDYGTRVKGLLLATDVPAEMKGTNKAGKPYSFITRRSQVFDGANTVVLAETADKIEDLPPAPSTASVVSFAVERARMDGRQMVFNGKFLTL